MRAIKTQVEQGQEYLLVKVQGGMQKILLSDVIFFSSEVRKLIAHMKDGEKLWFYGQLNELEKMLPEASFLRCHQSFLVNQSMIKLMRREYFIVHGIQIPVSRNCYLQMKEKGIFTRGVKKPKHTEEMACITGVEGDYKEITIRINPNQKVLLGNDYQNADIVIRDPNVADVHCWVEYNEEKRCYFLCNQSDRALSINGGEQIEPGNIVLLQQGDIFRLGQTEQIFRVGECV